VAYVTNAPQVDGSIARRFIEKFDLPPKSEKNVFVAYWFSREPPYTDDKDINLFGPTSAGFGGNRCVIPALEEILQIKIQAQNIDSQDVRCRVWIDETSPSTEGFAIV
jgi:hypothetical protein